MQACKHAPEAQAHMSELSMAAWMSRDALRENRQQQEEAGLLLLPLKQRARCTWSHIVQRAEGAPEAADLVCCRSAGEPHTAEPSEA